MTKLKTYAERVELHSSFKTAKCRLSRCQAKFLTSAKFLTCYCFSVISLLRIKK